MPLGRVHKYVTESVRRCYGDEIVRETLKGIGKLATVSKFDGVDYQTNVAFKIAKRLKKNPKEVAENIVDSAPTCSAVSSVSASSNGFVNMRLSDNYLQAVVKRHVLKQSDQYGRTNKAKNVLIDFCSPNIGKQLHPGHMRSMFWGDTISNILEFCGHRVTRVSHVGDFGLPVALLTQHCLENIDRLDWVKGILLEKEPSFSLFFHQICINLKIPYYASFKRKMGHCKILAIPFNIFSPCYLA